MEQVSTWGKHNKFALESEKGWSWFSVPSFIRWMQVKDNRTKKYVIWHCSDEILFETWFGEILGYAFFKKDAFQSLSIYVWFILSRTHSFEPHTAPSLWDITAQRGFLLVAKVLRIAIPWLFKLTSGSDKKISPDCKHHACSFLNRLSNCHKALTVSLQPFPGSRRLITNAALPC